MVNEVKRPPTVVEIASQQIETAIFAGELKMGQPLREAQLMKDLNVSRGTVRQALVTLQDRGLVDVLPHRGASVVSLNHRDVIQTYSARALIEPYAALLSFRDGRLDGSIAEHLAGVLDKMRQAEESGDLPGITRFDLEFHESLLKASNHQLLLSMFRTLLARTRLCMYQNILLTGVRIGPNPHEHNDILLAIERQSIQELVRLLLEHSCKALDHYLRHQPALDGETTHYQKSLMSQLPWMRLVNGMPDTAEPVIPAPCTDANTENVT